MTLEGARLFELHRHIPKIYQTGIVHSLKINVDEKNSWRRTADHIVGQFILVLNNFNVNVERVD